MSLLDQIVNVNITQQTQAIPQESFSVPLIVGSTVPTTGIVNAYTDPAGLLDNGYTTSSPEYVYALEMFEQQLSPTIFYVGKRTATVIQVDTITPTAINDTHYIVTIAGTPYDYLSDGSATVSEIVAGLIALINADPTAPCTASGSTTLILTANISGNGFNTTVNANMALVHTTANHGIADDMAAITLINNLWYGVALCSNLESDILQMASYIEALTKIFIGVSNDSDIPTAVTTDVASILKGKSYKRTALMYSPLNHALGIEAAWLGGQLPATPGSNNWAFKTLVGISPDVFTGNQSSIMIGDPVAEIAGKNVNIYQIVGGVDITQMGTMAGGQYIDITIGIDWLVSQLQTNVYQNLVQSVKVPYTDKGTGVFISAVRAAIDLGVTNGLIDGNSPIVVTAPSVLSVPSNQRAARVAPTIKFSCRLAGAFNAVQISGTVTV